MVYDRLRSFVAISHSAIAMRLQDGIQLNPDVVHFLFMKIWLQILFPALVVAFCFVEVDARRTGGDRLQTSLADGIKGVVRIVPVGEPQAMDRHHEGPAFYSSSWEPNENEGSLIWMLRQ
jgi:hypothetical protein